jgi:hypothetical protein
MLREGSQTQKDKNHVFPHIQNLDLKTKGREHKMGDI